VDVGVGLWAMRATARKPRSFPGLYAELLADARLAEDLGFHSLWIAEHHFWYDGWCPAPLVAASAVLGATTRLHVGTGIALLPLYEPDEAVAHVAGVSELAGGRLELGLGLGYRDLEFDAFGLARNQRGRRMEAGLEALARQRDGAAPDGERPARIWVGGMAPAAIQRAARHGAGVLLPQTLTIDQVRATMTLVRDTCAEAGLATPPAALMRHAWATDGGQAQAEAARAAIDATLREYTGSWFMLKGRPGFESPDALDKQVQRATRAALIGPPQAISDGLAELAEIGIDMVVLHLTSDGADIDLRGNLRALGEHLYPAVTA
jgi:alkanesulfonate monooxygenase SsuD/methylene tetrahydromethanopterin reductase-like flavin-dependent oxidoreductase (luciferase family)